MKTMVFETPRSPTAAPHFLHNNKEATFEPAINDLVADFNYYKDPGDGSRPPALVVGKPETYERPAEPRTMIVHNIRGEEDKYSLDGTGFQVYRHVSRETAFVDEAAIKGQYYEEVEEILKRVLVSLFFFSSCVGALALVYLSKFQVLC